MDSRVQTRRCRNRDVAGPHVQLPVRSTPPVTKGAVDVRERCRPVRDRRRDAALLCAGRVEEALVTTVAAEPVSLAELRALFAGEHVPDDQPGGGEWATCPTYSIGLACEIAKRVDPQTAGQLRVAIFGTAEPADIPTAALEAIKLGVDRYRMLRGGRGL